MTKNSTSGILHAYAHTSRGKEDNYSQEVPLAAMYDQQYEVLSGLKQSEGPIKCHGPLFYKFSFATCSFVMENRLKAAFSLVP